MTAYRLYGTTDDVTRCERCGKPELKGTVMLQILDRDGNAEEITYVGSTCAARMLGGRKTGAKIRDEAAGVNLRRAAIVENSRAMVDYYEPYEQQGSISLAGAYLKANAGYFRNWPDTDPLAMARDCLRRHREIIETGGISALN